MRQTTSKFNGINFPLFALKQKPYKILYDIHKIYAIKYKDSHKETIDDKNLSGDYFCRLIQLENRLKFDYTCKNLQDVIYAEPKWGIDSKAKPHDFSVKEAVDAKIVKIKKVSNNLVWLESISYPFRLNTKERLELVDETYATIVKVNNEWFIKNFSMEPTYTHKTIYI